MERSIRCCWAEANCSKSFVAGPMTFATRVRSNSNPCRLPAILLARPKPPTARLQPMLRRHPNLPNERRCEPKHSVEESNHMDNLSQLEPIPRPPGHLFVGNLFDLDSSRPVESLMDLARTYG